MGEPEERVDVSIPNKNYSMVKSSKFGYFLFHDIADDRRVFTWGRADYGQLGTGDDVIKLGHCSEATEVELLRGVKQVNLRGPLKKGPLTLPVIRKKSLVNACHFSYSVTESNKLPQLL